MVANTILQQLGGHGFAVMTGSRNFISLGNGLQMSLVEKPRDFDPFGHAGLPPLATI